MGCRVLQSGGRTEHLTARSSMNIQCPKCKWIHRVGPGNQRPPRCIRCGEAIKSDDDLPIKPEFANAPRGGARPAPLVKPMVSFDPEEELRHESGVSRGLFMMVLSLILAACTWLYARTSVATEG